MTPQTLRAAAFGLALLAPVLGLTLSPKPADAAGMNHDGVAIAEPWARASATSTARAGAAYMTLENHGAEADTLIGAETSAAARAEIHTHRNENGVMRMGLAGDVTIPPGGSVSFEPGGLHVMLIGLNAPLKQGEMVEFTLLFEKAGAVAVSAPIEAAGAKGRAGGHHGHAGHGAHGEGHGHGGGHGAGDGHGRKHGTTN